MRLTPLYELTMNMYVEPATFDLLSIIIASAVLSEEVERESDLWDPSWDDWVDYEDTCLVNYSMSSRWSSILMEKRENSQNLKFHESITRKRFGHSLPQVFLFSVFREIHESAKEIIFSLQFGLVDLQERSQNLENQTCQAPWRKNCSIFPPLRNRNNFFLQPYYFVFLNSSLKALHKWAHSCSFSNDRA